MESLRWLLRIVFLVVKAFIVPTESATIKRSIHTLSRWLLTHRKIRRLLAGLIYLGVLSSTEYILRLHEGQIPQTGIPAFLYSWALPTLILIGTVFLFNLPLTLASESTDRADEIVFRLSVRLAEAAKQVRNTGFTAEIDDLGAVPQALLRAVEERGDWLCVLTPNAVYLLVDQWMNKYPSLSPSNSAHLQILSNYAAGFRHALELFPGRLCMILPDPDEAGVIQGLRIREDRLQLPKDMLRQINKEAVRWVKDLSRVRKAARRVTAVRLTRHSPAYRFMLTEDKVFVQFLPEVEKGICQPVYVVDRHEHPIWSSWVESCLLTMDSLL